MRVVTIGSGIVGASCAYYLSRGGADVTLLDARTPAFGASGATFAWLNAFRKEPRAYHDLNRLSMEEYTTLVKRVNAEAFVHMDGALHWADSQNARQALEQRVERLRSWGYKCDLVRASAVTELYEPGLSVGSAVDGVVRTPEEGWVEVVPLIRQLLAGARDHGASVEYPAEVQAMSARGDGGIGVHLRDGRTLESDAVVIAAGPESGVLADSLGLHLPLEKRPGLLAVSKPSIASLKHVVYAPEVHFRPDAGGRILTGLGSHDRHEVSPPPERQLELGTELMRTVSERLPAFRGTGLDATRIGVRPIPADGYPVIGWLSDRLPIYAAVTHSGVTLAPIVGRACAIEILHGREVPEIASFRADRFAAA